MSHYVVDYSADTPQEMHANALNDACQYLGGKKFASLLITATQERDKGWCPTLEQFEFFVSFAGIRGYPCRAIYNEVWPFG